MQLRFVVCVALAFHAGVAEFAHAQQDIVESLLEQTQNFFLARDYARVAVILESHERLVESNWRLSHCYGTSQRALGNVKLAERFLRASIIANRKFIDSRWQLAQMDIESKNWDRADAGLSDLRNLMPGSDPRNRELDYLSGVVAYQKERNFEAQNHMMRALLWGPGLNLKQRGSAQTFLASIAGKSLWTFAFPVGASWDGNLWRTSLSANSQTQSLGRTMAGGMVSRRILGSTSHEGWNANLGASVFHSSTLNREFKNLDFSVAGLSLNQSYSGRATMENQSPWSGGFAQNLSVIFLGGKPETAEATLSFSTHSVELSVGADADVANRAQSTGITPRDYATAKQALYPEIVRANWKLGADFVAEERWSLNTISDNHGDSFAFTTTPRWQLNVLSTGRTVARVEMPLAIVQEFFGIENFTNRATPTLGARWYATPWLMFNASGSYEFSLTTTKDKQTTRSTKPAGSLMATMVF